MICVFAFYGIIIVNVVDQRWSRRHKARGQGQPFREQTLSSQEQECSRPRTKDTGANVLQKKVLKFFFRRSPKKRSSKTFFRRSTKFLQFKKYCCPRAKDRAIFEDLRLRGQGHQNVSSRSPPLLLINPGNC